MCSSGPGFNLIDKNQSGTTGTLVKPASLLSSRAQPFLHCVTGHLIEYEIMIEFNIQSNFTNTELSCMPLCCWILSVFTFKWNSLIGLRVVSDSPLHFRFLCNNSGMHK